MSDQKTSGEPVAWSFKEYVWATGLGSYVWRDQLEADRPNEKEREVREVVPLYAEQPAPVAVETVIHGSKLDEYDSVLDALDPESVCPYLSNGEVSELVSAVRTLQVGQITRAAPVAVVPKSECPNCLGDAMFGCDTCIPDFTPGNGNKARRRAESLGLTAPTAPTAYDGFDNGVD